MRKNGGVGGFRGNSYLGLGISVIRRMREGNKVCIGLLNLQGVRGPLSLQVFIKDLNGKVRRKGEGDIRDVVVHVSHRFVLGSLFGLRRGEGGSGEGCQSVSGLRQ